MTNRITLQDYFKLFLISILFLPLFTLAGSYPPGNRKLLPDWYYHKLISHRWQELRL
ncbi:MAG: hypothetical protein WDM78_14600 [Puia sp.]